MKIVKFVSFYLFLLCNILLSLLFLITYSDDMVSDQMPWNAEGLGLAYKSKINYTIMTLSDVIVFIFPSVYAWRKRKENFIKALIAVSVPFVVLCGRVFIHKYFPELILWFADIL